jgi:hypothetical protein
MSREGFEPRYDELEIRHSCLSREAAEPLPPDLLNSLQTFEFREPYRIRRVQSFREKWVIWRRMSRHCRLEVRSSNKKSLLLLGLIANKFAQRIHGFGQAGGGKGIRTHDTEGRFLGPSSDYLPRNDWLSCLIGALLCQLGRGRGAPKGSCPAGWFTRRG